jgi:hypothetical protein
LRLPYLTARLIELGPGLRYLDQACTPPQYAVCAYRAQLPLPFNAFLFDRTNGVFGPAPFEIKEQLSEEQNRFAWHVFLFEPAQVTRGMIYDVARQLTMFSLDDIKIRDFDDKFPQPIRKEIETSKLHLHPELLQLWSTVDYLFVLFALIVIAISLGKLRSDDSETGKTFTLFLWLTALDVLANAFVCGMLASGEGRFQARVIWLVPLLAYVSWFMTRRLAPAIAHRKKPGNNLSAR